MFTEFVAYFEMIFKDSFRISALYLERLLCSLLSLSWLLVSLYTTYTFISFSVFFLAELLSFSFSLEKKLLSFSRTCCQFWQYSPALSLSWPGFNWPLSVVAATWSTLPRPQSTKCATFLSLPPPQGYVYNNCLFVSEFFFSLFLFLLLLPSYLISIYVFFYALFVVVFVIVAAAAVFIQNLIAFNYNF